MLDGDALGQGLAAHRRRLPGQGIVETGIEGGLDADDLDPGLEGLGRHGVAADEAAAAHRRDQHLEIRARRQHLERNGALPGDDAIVVVGMNEGKPLLGRELVGKGAGLGQSLAVEDDVGAEMLGMADFDEGGALGHHDGGRNVQAPGVVGHSLGMVPGRHGDDAAPPLLVRQALQLVKGAAVLERAGELQVLELDPELGAGDLGERVGAEERGRHDSALDRLGRCLHVFDGHAHHAYSCGSPAAGTRVSVPSAPAAIAARSVLIGI
jgi:hypothetical protein